MFKTVTGMYGSLVSIKLSESRELGLLIMIFLKGDKDSDEAIAGSWCELFFGGLYYLKLKGSWYSLFKGDGMIMAVPFLLSTELFCRFNKFN